EANPDRGDRECDSTGAEQAEIQRQRQPGLACIGDDHRQREQEKEGEGRPELGREEVHRSYPSSRLRKRGIVVSFVRWMVTLLPRRRWARVTAGDTLLGPWGRPTPISA